MGGLWRGKGVEHRGGWAPRWSCRLAVVELGAGMAEAAWAHDVQVRLVVVKVVGGQPPPGCRRRDAAGFSWSGVLPLVLLSHWISRPEFGLGRKPRFLLVTATPAGAVFLLGGVVMAEPAASTRAPEKTLDPAFRIRRRRHHGVVPFLEALPGLLVGSRDQR